jgi:hypothetical protein
MAQADPPSASARGPCARRTILASFRSAALDLWGPDGLRRIGEAMPEASRRATVEPVVLADEWIPEEHVMAWYEAAWTLSERNDAEYCRFLDRMMDVGFGRVRKLLLNLASVATVATKAPELWRHDHTSGVLRSEYREGEVTLCLRDHIYTTTPLARRSIAEIYRYVVSLTGRKHVTATHSLEPDGELRVRLRY